MTSDWQIVSEGLSQFEKSFQKKDLNLDSAAKLRRDLLDFVDGIGIASFSLSVIEQVPGEEEKRRPVSHQLCSVAGLYESVYEIAENLEGVILVEEDGASGSYPKVVSMRFSAGEKTGGKEISAGDFRWEFLDERVGVVNPEHRIMRLVEELGEGAKQFELSLEIRRYSNELGIEGNAPVSCDIPLNPRVSVVTRCSVQENEEGIVLLVITNGSCAPEEVLEKCEARNSRQFN